MIEKLSQFEEQVAFFFKVILPSILGVSIKIAVQVKREQMTWFRMLLAYICGVGLAWLCAPVIVDAVSKNYVPLVIAIVAISADKVFEYIIYKFDVDGLLTSLFEVFRQGIINFFTTKK